MTDSEGPDERRRDPDRRHREREQEQAELDLLLSAELDGELEPLEVERLAALRQRHPDHAARLARFQEVDGAMRSLAETPIPAERLAVPLRILEARLARSESARPIEVESRSGSESGSAMRWIKPALWAAAAALVLYLIAAGSQRATAPAQSPLFPPTATELAEEPLPASTFASDDEALVLALDLFEGEAEGQSEALVGEETFGAISDEDFDIVEQLDLLEFLAAREREGRG
jgi:anti-sigma factor RsiW